MNAIGSLPRTNPVPLALTSAGFGDAARAAQGFGAATSAQVAMLERQVQSLTSNLLDGKLLSINTQADAGAVVGKNGQPLLAPPDMARIERALGVAGINQGPGRLGGASALTALLGLLTKSMGAQSLADMRANASQRNAQLQARGAQEQKLDQALQAARQAEETAAGAAEGAAAESEQAVAAAEAARAEAERLQKELDGMDPQAPEYADAEAALAEAHQKQAQAQQRSEGAAARALDAANALRQATDDYNTALGNLNDFNREDPTGIRPPALNELNSRSARMQALIGQLSEIMSDASLDKLRSEADAAMKQMEASQKEQLRLAQDQEKELERMREAETKSGCSGKVFGWLGKSLAVVGAAMVIGVGAFFCPALLVAGVVLMALAIDSIQGEFTGVSVMGKVTEAMGGMIAKALMALGVDETVAQQIGYIVATIVIMVAIIAGTLITANVGGAVSTVSKVATTLKKIVEIVQVMAQMANLASTVAVGAGNIIVAGIQVEIAKLLAMLEKLGFNDEVLREMLAMVQEAGAQLNRTAADLMSTSSDILAEEVQTAKAVLQKIGTTARGA